MTKTPSSIDERWLRLAIVTGFIASVSYPVMVFVALPRAMTVALGAAFGPSLAIASAGLYVFLRNDRPTVAASIAGAANVIAGAIVTMMILVQLALRYPQLDAIAASGKNENLQAIVHWVWYVVLGLDVSFDVFIGLGTFCFALRMLTHPRFGRVFGILGMALSAVLLLGLNFYTFPYPPREVGLTAFDPGPHTAIWYLAVTIQMWRSIDWFRSSAESEQIDQAAR